MKGNGVKDLFKIVDCKKSQSAIVNVWYWTFASQYTSWVIVKVTTLSEKEEDAWKELELAVSISSE